MNEELHQEAASMRLGLKAALLQRNLSQRELGRISNIPENKLSSIINGWTEPSGDERRRLAAALHQSEATLFDAGASIEIRGAR
jgi:transcriptional regulator with XRE-family HTH domain